MEIKTWEDAGIVAAQYAAVYSQLERLTEELKAFAEGRHDQVGKARHLGPVIIGFRKEATALVIEDEAAAIAGLEAEIGVHDFSRLVKQVQEIDRPGLKKYYLQASSVLRDCLSQLGISLRDGCEKFYVKLARNSEKG
jgi:hypothetical protein